MGTDIKTVITDRADTPHSSVDAILVRLSPLRIVLTRAGRVYLMAVIAFLALQGIGLEFDATKAIPLMTFGTIFLNALSVAVGPAVVSALWNTAELFFKVDERNPAMRA